MQLRFVLSSVVLFLAAATQLYASTVTYAFSGVASLENIPGTGSSLGPIVPATPLAGSFTIDLAAAGQPSGIPGATDYSQQIPSANFSVTLAGLTIQTPSTGGGLDVEIGLSVAGIVDTFSLTITGESLSGPDWSFSPDANGQVTTTALSLKFPLNFLSDLAHLPTLSADAFAKTSKVIILLGAGTYEFPGGSTTINPGDESEILFNLASLTLVPEPSPLVLAAIGLVGLVLFPRWRNAPACHCHLAGAARNSHWQNASGTRKKLLDCALVAKRAKADTIQRLTTYDGPLNAWTTTTSQRIASWISFARIWPARR